MSIYYSVNDKKFNNNYLAYYESYKTGKAITFHVHEELYDTLDWSKEPVESFELLMDIHAHRLRQKYNYLILNWSGGTDSHTIYNVFKRNNIHIDEIIIKASAHSAGFPEINHEWIQKNHWDPTTTITNGNLRLPSAMPDGAVIKVSSTQTITNLSFWALGTTITPSANVTLTGGTAIEFFYHAAESKWYKVA